MNYANADMVGHSGKLEAAIKASRRLTQARAHLSNTAATRRAWIITADHGNAET